MFVYIAAIEICCISTDSIDRLCVVTLPGAGIGNGAAYSIDNVGHAIERVYPFIYSYAK